ncbi:MAG: NAD-dependent epimerase/dehydratase family protein [Bacteroidota bacterium]
MGLDSEKQSEKRKLFIIGSKARLAKAIASHYASYELIKPDRIIYENWGKTGKQEEIGKYFKSRISNDALIFITSGILNAAADKSIIEEVNYHLPWNIIQSLEGLDVQIVTFGTILENLRDTENNYVQSKIKLSDKISELNNRSPKVSHFRLHTLYGYDDPVEFMFLGQVFQAIKEKSLFNMSSGLQIREYQHLDDVVSAVDHIIRSDIRGVSEITSGTGIQLRELALSIFEAFKLEHLINIGSLDIKYKEKFSNDYQKNPDLNTIYFREPKKGVITYLKSRV